MVRKLRMNESDNSFDETDFGFYIEDICEKAIEYLEGQYPVQIISKEFPTYDSNWCAGNTDGTLEQAREKALRALVDYEMLALLYEKDSYKESRQKSVKKFVKESLEDRFGDSKWVDTYGEMGEDGEIWTFQDLKDFWDREHDNDPLLVMYKEQDPNFDFEEWFYDTIGVMREYDDFDDDEE